MPIIESAIKRMRQNAVRRDRRKPVKTFMKTMMRTMEDLAKEGKKDDLIKMLPQAYKAIDMAAKINILHKKNAARKKARMAHLVAAK